MTPQPVHRRRPLLLISRADFKIRLLFHSRRLFDWFPADVCIGFDPQPGSQPTAGLIWWGEGRLQVKAAMGHPLSEAWWDPGPVCVSSAGDQLLVLCSERRFGGKALGLCKAAGHTEKSGTWVWFPYVVRYAGGGEGAIWRYLKELGLQMHSIVLLLPVACIWTCKYRTLSKKCQISVA